MIRASPGSTLFPYTPPFRPAQLANLTITPPANSTTPIALTVSAVSTEDNATTATIAKTLNVTIDQPPVPGRSVAHTPDLPSPAHVGHRPLLNHTQLPRPPST